MANHEQLTLLLNQGVEAWNQWRREHPEIEPDLSEADLSFANLQDADFDHADLTNACLNSANLETRLNFANLDGALQLHLFVGSVLSSQLEVRLRS